MSWESWEDRCNAAPLGTKAPAFNGGQWTKTERGWRWGKRGATFPTPGGDWTGELIEPGSDKLIEKAKKNDSTAA